MKMRRILFALALAALAGTTSHGGEYNGDWFCGSSPQIREFEIKADDFRINNLSFRERDAFFGGLRVIEFSFSAVNRRQKSVRVNAQAVGFDLNDKLIFALKASPMMDMVSEGKTETARGDAYTTGGDLKRTTKVCVKFVGDF
jgi:hypothetical protein